jgi:hypothetical protein
MISSNFYGIAYFYIIVDYIWRHGKGSAIYNKTRVNLEQEFWFHSTKMYLNTAEKLEQEKNSYIDTIFVIKNCSIYLFRAVNYSLMFVLCKDAQII